MSARNSICPNDDTYKYYFYFIQERMKIFWNKYHHKHIVTDDPILRENKFTNVYRACDRVSQYLINNVIYKDIDDYTPEDTMLRILVFKVFNKIETWEYLNQSRIITMNDYNVQAINIVLSERQKHCPIFSNAYMMAGSHIQYTGITTKHHLWLQIIKDYFLEGKGIQRILNASSMKDVYLIFRECPLIGDFLAYQYTIDMNYSPYLNFDENSFVKAGVGAVRGIKKCFHTYGQHFEDAIVYTQENFQELQERYGYTEFQPLFGRMPKLIDLQNCFCETDKYLRAKMPELIIGNTRIKQRYHPSSSDITYRFPRKWRVQL